MPVDRTCTRSDSPGSAEAHRETPKEHVLSRSVDPVRGADEPARLETPKAAIHAHIVLMTKNSPGRHSLCRRSISDDS